MSRPRLVLATGNAGKVRELSAHLDGWEVIPQSELGVAAAEETATSFVENALIKARNAAGATGLPAVADDSGLEVDALDGAPGVRSARYAGPGASDADNVARLLAELETTPVPGRTARFRCVVVLVHHAGDPAPLICQGTWEGRIALAPRGGNGFGYDPVFLVPGTGLTAAELDPAEKNRRSHRGQAMAALVRALDNRGS